MNTLNFNDADLKANREGRLSDAQAKRLDTDVEIIQQKTRYTRGYGGNIGCNRDWCTSHSIFL